MPDSRRFRRTRFIRVLLTGCIGALAALLTLPLVPASSFDLGPATVTTRVRLGLGTTTLIVPPLGNVSASTHSPPLALDLSLERVDFVSLGRLLTDPLDRKIMVNDLDADLRRLALWGAGRVLLAAAIVGGLAGALAWHRRWANVIAGAAGGVIALTLLLALTAGTFDSDAFEQPRFTGALVRAPQVIAAVDRGIGSLERLRSRYETAAQRLSALLEVVARPNVEPERGSVALLHVSDIHSNPLGVEITRQLARDFDVDAVVDTGDLTSFGAPIEARIGDLIAKIPVPYLFVPGNHDSGANRREIDRVRNVTLLDGDIARVEGIAILGWADPTFTASNEVTTEEGNDVRIDEAARVAAAADDVRPDVLAVHDSRLARQATGDLPLVLSGHTHERDQEQVGETIVLTVGSTGATGLGSFLVEADMAYEAEIIYLRRGRAVTVDYISFSGAGGDFQIERRTLPTPRSEVVGRPPPDGGRGVDRISSSTE